MNREIRSIMVISVAVMAIFVGISYACDDIEHGDDRDYGDVCVTCPPGSPGSAGKDGSIGARGPRGLPGRDGITTIIHRYVCPECVEQRIDLGDAISAALPAVPIDTDKRFALALAAGFAEEQWALGAGVGLRASDHLTFSAALATNLTGACDGDEDRHPCIDPIDPFDHLSGRLQLSLQF